MSLITLSFCILFSILFFMFSLHIFYVFRGGLRFHLINVEMNTEILLSLEIIFYYYLFLEERKAQKKNEKSWLQDEEVGSIIIISSYQCC